MRRFPAGILLVLTFALGAMSAMGFGGLAAQAEEPRKKSLLELLFQRQETAAPPARDNSRPAAKPRRKEPAPARATTGASRLLEKPLAAAPVEKLADAKVILVIGDFLAAGLAGGLTEAFAQAPGLRVVNAANGDSGLVRDDFHDWDAEVGPLIDLHKPSAVVVLIGTNDRQAMQVAGQREAVLTPAWTGEYRRRAQSLASAVTGRQVPLFWVSQLPQRASSANAGMLALNDIFRDVTGSTRTDLQYVDVWEGFVDEGGRFMERGPDINGQTVALRSGQVNVTRAGFRKVAFYVERVLGRIASAAPAAVAAGTGGGFGNTVLPPLVLGLPDVEANFARMRPIDLLAPDANESGVLMGESVTPTAPAPLAPASSPPAGRIDDFQVPALRR
jgi:hypothetical protein